MAPVVNKRLIYKSVPTGYPEPGVTTSLDSSETIDLDNVALNGGLLIKVLDLSVDPYIRGLMRDPSIESYAPAYQVDQPTIGLGIGIVLRSEAAGAQAGDHVIGFFQHVNYFIANDLATWDLRVITNPHKLPLTSYLGVLGMPGRAAWIGWKEYAHAKKGDTVFVTSGAGPVGSVVIQIAKLEGLKVIASAGSDEKVAFMKELGADVAFNYKTTEYSEILSKEGPIDIYWDSVGGKSLEAALNAAKQNARFIECGMIAHYNAAGMATPINNLVQLLTKSITMTGFIVFHLQHKYYDQFYADMEPKVAAGQIKFTEQVFNGLESLEEAILAVQKGTNSAKAVVHVADA